MSNYLNSPSRKIGFLLCVVAFIGLIAVLLFWRMFQVTYRDVYTPSTDVVIKLDKECVIQHGEELYNEYLKNLDALITDTVTRNPHLQSVLTPVPDEIYGYSLVEKLDGSGKRKSYHSYKGKRFCTPWYDLSEPLIQRVALSLGGITKSGKPLCTSADACTDLCDAVDYIQHYSGVINRGDHIFLEDPYGDSPDKEKESRDMLSSKNSYMWSSNFPGKYEQFEDCIRISMFSTVIKDYKKEVVHAPFFSKNSILLGILGSVFLAGIYLLFMHRALSSWIMGYDEER